MEKKRKELVFYPKKNKKKYFEFSSLYPFRENYEKYHDVWVKRLVDLGLDLEAKNSQNCTVKEFFQSEISMSSAIESHLSDNGFGYICSHKNLSTTLKNRVNFTKELIEKRHSESLSLTHYLLSQNLFTDSFNQIKVSHVVLPKRSDLIHASETKAFNEQPLVIHSALTEPLDEEVKLIRDVYAQIIVLYGKEIPERWESNPPLKLNLPV